MLKPKHWKLVSLFCRGFHFGQCQCNRWSAFIWIVHCSLSQKWNNLNKLKRRKYFNPCHSVLFMFELLSLWEFYKQRNIIPNHIEEGIPRGCLVMINHASLQLKGNSYQSATEAVCQDSKHFVCRDWLCQVQATFVTKPVFQDAKKRIVCNGC